VKFYLAKKDCQHNYIPAFAEDLESSCKVKEGDIVEVKVVDARNVMRHRKLMKCFDIGFNNQERFKDKTKYKGHILIKVGWCIPYMDEKGDLYFTPKSINFEDLSEEKAFLEEVYNPCVEEIAKQLDLTKEELAMEILNNF
jgi:hypothetical protein